MNERYTFVTYPTGYAIDQRTGERVPDEVFQREYAPKLDAQLRLASQDIEAETEYMARNAAQALNDGFGGVVTYLVDGKLHPRHIEPRIAPTILSGEELLREVQARRIQKYHHLISPWMYE